ncbi:MAG: HAD family phosphatase [Anaerolineales bacterium]|nr:HAD family phosphatase [Anaerolineales bacterium]
MIRLLALDLDGTVVGDDLQVPATVRDAIAEAQARGVIVTLATGRMFAVALPFARDLKLSAPIICYQGALIQTPGAAQPLYLATMDAALMSEVLDWQAECIWQVVLYTATEAFALERRYSERFSAILARERLRWVTDFGEVIQSNVPVKFLVVAEPDEADQIEAQLGRRFDGRIAIVRSHAAVVEGSPLDATKGSALRWVAQHLGIAQADTMAIGDQDNDASMVAWAGVGVAMGNGSPACQAAADWVAPPFSQHGAAVAIERFILEDQAKQQSLRH